MNEVAPRVPQHDPLPETPGERRRRLFEQILRGVPGLAAVRQELSWRRLVQTRRMRLVDRERFATRILAIGEDATLGSYRVVLRAEDDGAGSVGLEASPRTAMDLAFVIEPNAAYREQPPWPERITRVDSAIADLQSGWTVHTNDAAMLRDFLTPEVRTGLRAHAAWTVHRDRGVRMGVGWPGRVTTTADREGRSFDDALALLRMLHHER